MHKIQQFPLIVESRVDKIVGFFSNLVRNIVAFLKSPLNCEHHLLNPMLLEELVLKLPASKQFEWSRCAAGMLGHPTIETFSNWLVDGPRTSITVYAMLDEGSSITLLEESIADELGIKGRSTSLTLQWYNTKQISEQFRILNLQISGVDHKTSFQLKNVHTIKHLDLPTQSFDRNNYRHLSNLPIASYSAIKPSLLIGLDNSQLSATKEMVCSGPNEPIAVTTKLGWVAYGPTHTRGCSTSNILHIRNQFTTQQLQLVQEYTVSPSRSQIFPLSQRKI
ncbi:PREDICTED: uncharacterized protein LOC108364548 [Rhagoletis zephyria]|uniref:uncharacterized protein LOC108364548 n=1 Tax=Rhagoletis zephyria TaxID=28612 RepID=UPI00081143FD|nr:PREDICTED: uncharacterized protein LOC108364548 [Rhagoletis zephyria]